MSNEIIKQEQKPLVPTTSKQLLEIYNPNACMRSLKGCNTVVKAMQSGTPTLAALSRSMSDAKIEAYLKIWLINLNETLDLKKPLTEQQIDKIAFRILENYRSLNIADINLIFKNAEMGVYGETYDRLTVTTVLKWFRDYFDNRCNMAGELSYQQHVQHKSLFSGLPRSSETNMREQMAELKKNYEHDRSMAETKKSMEKAKKEYNKKQANGGK